MQLPGRINGASRSMLITVIAAGHATWYAAGSLTG